MNFEMFTVANRALNSVVSAMSIAAAWIWAPALFISAQVAYTWGLLGLLLFVVPNVLAVVLFAYAVEKIKYNHSNGYTLTDVIKNSAHPILQKMYSIEMLLLAVFAVAVQVIAGVAITSLLFPGIPVLVIMTLLVAIPAIYTTMYGIKASIVADAVFYVVMLVTLTVVLYAALGSYPVSNMVFSGAFKVDMTTLLLSFGIPTSIGLLSGIFGSQDFYQRTFSTSRNNIRKTFLTASFLFALVPIGMGILGFMAAGTELQITNILLVNFSVVDSLNSSMLSYGLSFVIIAGLISTIDSSQMSASTLLGHSIFKDSMKSTRISLLVISLLALLIAYSGITVLQLFLVYGALRSSVLGITLIIIFLDRKVYNVVVPITLCAVWVVLLPINAFAVINKLAILQTCMAISIVAIPATVAYIFSTKDNR